uniref:Uncharacterized protein LOC113786686 n=1 Tax=Cicer arietinum TaxID=3827 RepID=A0A3Q7XA83_CICAR|nr:uncharacterized protein LOC113786686 [Cicer arietinum]
MKEDEWKLLDRQAFGVIRLTLSRNVVVNFAKEKTTTSLMSTLFSMCEKSSSSSFDEVVVYVTDNIRRKQKRFSFQRNGRTPKKKKFELVHSDVWGLTIVSSIGGKHYFMNFIDDHSRNEWIYFLKHKSEVFETFKKWKVMVENEIKKLITDNGGEYEDIRFKKLCYKHDIRMERTVPSMPQHNGVVV